MDVGGGIDLLALMFLRSEQLSVIDFAKYLWTLQTGWINHLWYMGALICIYFFFPVLKAAFDSHKEAFCFFVISCAILTFGNTLINILGNIVLYQTGLVNRLDIGRYIKNGYVALNWFNVFNPFRDIYGYAFVYFCVGGLAHGWTEKIKTGISEKKRNIFAGCVICLSCGGLFITGLVLSKSIGTMWDVVFLGYDTVFTFINVLMIFVLSLSYERKIKLIEDISRNTLGVFFVHVVFVQLMGGVANRFTVSHTYIFNLFYAVFILLVSLGFTVILSKIPVIRRLVRL